MSFVNGLLLTAAPTTIVMAPGQTNTTSNLGKFNDSGLFDSFLNWVFSNPVISAVFGAIAVIVLFGIVVLVILDFK